MKKSISFLLGIFLMPSHCALSISEPKDTDVAVTVADSDEETPDIDTTPRKKSLCSRLHKIIRAGALLLMAGSAGKWAMNHSPLGCFPPQKDVSGTCVALFSGNRTHPITDVLNECPFEQGVYVRDVVEPQAGCVQRWRCNTTCGERRVVLSELRKRT